MLDNKVLLKKVTDFLNTSLFEDYPELRDTISVAIGGSLALSLGDEHSDVDLNFYISDQNNFENLSDQIISFKKSHPKLTISGLPVQIHRPKLVAEEDEKLKTWTRDDALRETQTQLIAYDAHNNLQNLKGKYTWYPSEVYKEKLLWLYSEMIFEIKEHILIATKRDDIYFWQVSKMRYIKLYGNLTLMLNKIYPVYDKHLGYFLSQILSSEQQRLFNDLTTCNDMNEGLKMISTLRDISCGALINKEIITPDITDEYWVALRPVYSIEGV